MTISIFTIYSFSPTANCVTYFICLNLSCCKKKVKKKHTYVFLSCFLLSLSVTLKPLNVKVIRQNREI